MKGNQENIYKKKFIRLFHFLFPGFLKTGAKSSTQGNFGLMDLVAGLHWLRENLPAFNGNPDNVTLMGHGTGAALANILIVSPVASGKSDTDAHSIHQTRREAYRLKLLNY